MRNEVFEPFLRIEKSFNIKKVLTRINESNDKKALKELLNNIKNFYFKSWFSIICYIRKVSVIVRKLREEGKSRGFAVKTTVLQFYAGEMTAGGT